MNRIDNRTLPRTETIPLLYIAVIWHDNFNVKIERLEKSFQNEQKWGKVLLTVSKKGAQEVKVNIKGVVYYSKSVQKTLVFLGSTLPEKNSPSLHS